MAPMRLYVDMLLRPSLNRYDVVKQMNETTRLGHVVEKRLKGKIDPRQ